MLRYPLLIGTFVLACVWLLTHTSSEAIASVDGSITYPGFEVRAVEEFTLEARVLSRKDYSSGRETKLSPLDLAVGWGPMAKTSVVDELTISQRNRWYFWKARKLPIPRNEIIRHSSNVHIIPGNVEVAAALSKIRQSDNVRLSGRLVDVHTEDGWQWRTSRSRADSGAGACELLWLEKLEWI